MKILLLTRYNRTGASSRVRTLQYISYFQSLEWEVNVVPFFSQKYLQNLYTSKSNWNHVLLAYIRRVKALIGSGGYDLIWIEKELFPFLPAVVERLFSVLGVRYVVDYDDALFHSYDLHRLWPIRTLLGRKIDTVMCCASLVVVGNQYLATRALEAGTQRVEIVPTVIDLNRYPDPVFRQKKPEEPLIVGWIGTPKTSRYLYLLTSVFESLTARFNVRFVAVGASKKSLGNLPVESWPWTEGTEVNLINQFDIGIMPLHDSPWERGKCGYKLIQYMACRLPVVASPVGVNTVIVEPGVNGFLASEGDQWCESLASLLAEPELRVQMGNNGRKKVESTYSLQVQAPRLERLFQQLL